MDEGKACDIFNQYSNVIILGDSLGRHTAQGIMMILSQDLKLGGFPRGQNKRIECMNDCGCDGQFSEFLLCRDYDLITFLPPDARDHGFCTRLPSDLFKFRYVDSCCIPDFTYLFSADPRPILFVLNGGTHYESDPDAIQGRLLNGLMDDLINKKANCQWDIQYRFLWSV